ncbi:hypothetical protein TNCV_4840051 [Trichonephila clavipes]|nr:hypothetical protein TNCV_4840051 [Trichonephila clavipes]
MQFTTQKYNSTHPFEVLSLLPEANYVQSVRSSLSRTLSFSEAEFNCSTASENRFSFGHCGRKHYRSVRSSLSRTLSFSEAEFNCSTASENRFSFEHCGRKHYRSVRSSLSRTLSFSEAEFNCSTASENRFSFEHCGRKHYRSVRSSLSRTLSFSAEFPLNSIAARLPKIAFPSNTVAVNTKDQFDLL